MAEPEQIPAYVQELVTKLEAQVLELQTKQAELSDKLAVAKKQNIRLKRENKLLSAELLEYAQHVVNKNAELDRFKANAMNFGFSWGLVVPNDSMDVFPQTELGI